MSKKVSPGQTSLFAHINDLANKPEVEQKPVICEQKIEPDKRVKSCFFCNAYETEVELKPAKNYSCLICDKCAEKHDKPEKEAPIERVFKNYCLYCRTTENLSFVDSEKAYVCSGCKEVYCS